MNALFETSARGCAFGLLLSAMFWALAGCAVFEYLDSLPESVPPSADMTVSEADPEPEPVADDEVNYAALQWTCGGFAAPRAEPCNGVAIADLRISASGLSYRYEEGDLTALSPANSHENADCIAALFCRVAGVWQGGKMDWISSDRLTRDWHNVRGGYKGWSGGLLDSADAFAFVIVSGDGRRRTNVILSEGGLP